MAPVTNAPVLVTGPTGYIGAHVALNLLQHGYSVRGTVRSQEKFDQLLAQPAFQQYKDKFTAVIVEDLVTGDFTEAVKGVDVVVHTASPFKVTPENPEETYLKPAIQGTKGVIEAAIKSGTVKNIVITSSFAAIVSPQDGVPFNERLYTESDWNSSTYEEAVKSDTPGFAYRVSKKVAEQTANELVKGKPIKLAAINPPLVLGPYVHAVAKLDDLNESLAQLWAALSGRKGKDLPPTGTPAVADVRDLADAHRLAFEKDQEGRFIVYNGPFDWAQLVDIARRDFPEQAENTPEPKDSDRVSTNPKVFHLDSTKSKEVLGLKYHTVEQTLHDTIEQLYAEHAEGK
ncbi:hypothetical protein OC846_003745 [Tilletia horrida]|uniref:NAD-dependent epimerase/dehydratase domain-containing protein n=1 Tax=Tilletia horrida TaxID=155126 RepID=A0AAN6GP47_9BASI|nr:hypothetical protein OC845_003591 [Tilletia horrida]KAK0550265.1 hypothetical protein OC846_003745 [Tilletia horrida]KAK0565409.1 hypothetical protein OC861_003779 [Tilletia horrida]